MIEITDEWYYEREACDCCEGWYNKRYHLTVAGEDVGVFDDLEELLLEASSRTMDITYNQTDCPDTNYD